MESEYKIELDEVFKELHVADSPDRLKVIELPPLVDIQFNQKGKVVKPEQNIVKIGMPVDKNGNTLPQRTPCVFFADEVVVADIKHPEGIQLSNMLIIEAHGYWDRKNECWKFADKQVVKNVVDSWNKYACMNGYPPVNMVIACNTQKESRYQQKKFSEKLRVRFDAKYAQREEERDLRNLIVKPNINAPNPVVESFGKIVHVIGFQNPFGKLFMSAEIFGGEFLALDDLLASRKLQHSITINP